MGIKTIKACRVCGSTGLMPILSFGEIYVSDFLDKGQEGFKAPLSLMICKSCYLLQLEHTVPKEPLYRNYWYASGTNQTMRNALADITARAEATVKLKADDMVVDIGSNDSTLLRSYRTNYLRLVGFEPAKNLMEKAKLDHGTIINNFFNHADFTKAFGSARAKVITSVAMFYDLDDPNTFVEDINKCLDDNGIWINELGWAPMVFDVNAFDYMCHEHLELYTLYSMENLLKRHNLEVMDVETNGINGGSFRLFIRKKGSKVTASPGADERVRKMRDYENEHGYTGLKVYTDFADRSRRLRTEIHDFIANQVKNGKRVYAYGASTKGNTLLQYCGLDHTLIVAAADRNPTKWGKFTVGTNIPIISEEQARIEKPDFFLALPWAFIKEFREREKEFYAHGGRFIVPLPEIRIVE